MFFNGFPGGFPGMGGFGDAEDMPDSGDDSGSSSNNTKYYETIGVAKTATQQEITKAYRKKALQLHPDKHPDEKEKYQALFQELQEAYEVLNDPDKRKLYDRYGEAGLKGSSQSGMSDIFDVFFGGRGGGGGHGRGHGGQKKAPAIKLPLDVTLEDLYLGATKGVEYKRYVLCRKCDGKGGAKVIECSECGGQGVIIQMQRMGYMTLQQQRPCPKCNGEGTMIKESDKCKQCDGKGLKEEHQILEVTIPVGSKHAEQMTVRGRGHEIPDQANGDVVLILRCNKHELFTRLGADLAMSYTLSLKEALCGYDIRIPHLSGRTLRVKSKPGEIVQHEEMKVIYGQGMPQKGGTQIKGHLYIKFKIKLPDANAFTDEMLTKIKDLLPEDKKDEKENDVDMKDKDKNKNKNKNKNKTNENNKEQNKDESGEKTQENQEEEEEEEQDLEIHAEAETVEGEPAVTPASSKSAYDEDEEENQGVSCRHM